MERVQLYLKNQSDKFILSKHKEHETSKLMYHKIQEDRLQTLSKNALDNAKSQQEQNNITQFVPSEISEIAKDKRCIIEGIIYKKMSNKPTPLSEQSKYGMKRSFFDIKVPLIQSSSNDQLLFDDMSSRIRLNNIQTDKLKVEQICTGIPAALVGTLQCESFSFDVEDIFYSGISKQLNQPKLPKNYNLNNKKYVAFISGLNILNANSKFMENHYLSLDALLEFLQGNLNDPEKASQIGALVIAGNITGPIENISKFQKKSYRRKDLYNDIMDKCTNALDTISDQLTQLVVNIPVLLIPGKNDICSGQWPQQPINPLAIGLIPGRYSNLKSCTNPAKFDIGIDNTCFLRFLGTDGENIADQWKYASVDEYFDENIENSNQLNEIAINKEEYKKHKISWLEILERTLNTSLIAPTSPDTLQSHPFINDPFIIDECPNVYFAGNCPEGFSTKLISNDNAKCRLICIPSFIDTKEIVLLDLTDTLNFNVETLQIDCSDIAGIEWEKDVEVFDVEDTDIIDVEMF